MRTVYALITAALKKRHSGCNYAREVTLQISDNRAAEPVRPMSGQNVENQQTVQLRVHDSHGSFATIQEIYCDAPVARARRHEISPYECRVLAFVEDRFDAPVVRRFDCDRDESLCARTCRFPHLQTQFGSGDRLDSRLSLSGNDNDSKRSASVVSNSIKPCSRPASRNVAAKAASDISARKGANNSGVGSPCTVFMLTAILAARSSSHGSISTHGSSATSSSRLAITR